MSIFHCVGCDKDLELKMGVVRDSFGLTGNAYVCKKCWELAGLPSGMKGKLLAGTHSEKWFWDKLVANNPDRTMELAEIEQKKQIRAENKAKCAATFAKNQAEKKKITELTEKKQEQYTCLDCGEVWYFGESDKLKNVVDGLAFNPITIGRMKNPSQCPKCGSSASRHKTMKYWMDKQGNCVKKEE